MDENILNRLLSEYHGFCLNLIEKIPKEHYNDDQLMETAFSFKNELEVLILELQNKSSIRGLEIYTKEIEKLKGKIIDDQNGMS